LLKNVFINRGVDERWSETLTPEESAEYENRSCDELGDACSWIVKKCLPPQSAIYRAVWIIHLSPAADRQVQPPKSVAVWSSP